MWSLQQVSRSRSGHDTILPAVYSVSESTACPTNLEKEEVMTAKEFLIVFVVVLIIAGMTGAL